MTPRGTTYVKMTDEEKAILLEFGPKMTARQLMEKLPGRSDQWINDKRYALGASPGRSNNWDPAETHILESMPNATVNDLMVLLPGRSPTSISQKRKDMGLIPDKKISRFTPQENEYIRKAYSEFVLVPDMAKHLGRTIGVLRQHIMALGLHRENRRARLIARFGVGAADTTKSVDELKAEFVAKGKAAIKEKEAKTKEALDKTLEEMKASITNGTPRRQAFQFAMVEGATLNDIGKIYNISRERVRQIIYAVKTQYRYKRRKVSTGSRKRKPSGPFPMNCTKCGDPFEAKVRQTKYCSKCRPLMAKIQVQTYARRKSKETRIDKITQGIASLSPEERKQILAQLEGPNHATENNQPTDGQTSDDPSERGKVQGSD